MKTIGLIGGISWLSTIEYYRAINEMVNERLGGVHAAKLIVFSVDFAEIKELTFADDWEGLTAMMIHAARQLEKAGADCILIGANTMHRIADKVQGAIAVPLINIAAVTAAAVNQNGLERVALLGTRYVMQLDFYRDKLAEKNIETIIPAQQDIDYVNNAIYEEFGKGIFLPETKRQFLEIINRLNEMGAGGVIFGCTEIPILIAENECPIPSFDTTKLHARAAVDFALA